MNIQETNAPAGAQESLSSDADSGRVKGGDFDQNTMARAQGRGTEVSHGSAPQRVAPAAPNGQPGTPAPSDSPALGVAGVNVRVQPTDRRTIAGSTPGDFRARAADAKLPPNPAVREQMTETPNGEHCR
jgi:hypothetical protein